jgi:hypothetical protein
MFLRAYARYFDWKSDLQLNGAGIGSVPMSSWICSVSVGYRLRPLISDGGCSGTTRVLTHVAASAD